MLRRIVLAVVFVLVASSMAYSQQKPRHMEVELKNATYRGKVIWQNRNSTLLMLGDGRIKKIPANEIVKYRELSKPFKPFSAIEIKFQLAREFGKRYKVVGTSHFLVVGPKGRAEKYADLFEDILRKFRSSLSVRGIVTHAPEFPLVAIVFQDQGSFSKYAMKDKVMAGGIVGYYLPTSNRVALFELPRGISSLEESDPQISPEIFARGGKSSTLRDTIVHETTHQVAYNTGLHSRTGNTPKWVVEGMATVFEAPGIHNRSRGGGGMQKLNREMFLRVVSNLNKGIDKSLSLKRLVSSESMFQGRMLDAYSQAWALNYFLMEKHSPKYSRYLKMLAEKPSHGNYSSKERLADFEKTFGKNIGDFEKLFIDYYTALARKHLGRKSITTKNRDKNFVSTTADDDKKKNVKKNKRNYKNRRNRRSRTRSRNIRRRRNTRRRN